MQQSLLIDLHDIEKLSFCMKMFLVVSESFIRNKEEYSSFSDFLTMI